MTKAELKKPKGMDWWRLYRLYITAFPAMERKPFKRIVEASREGKSDVWCVVKDGKFTGLAITINGSDRILLDYFAVSKARRGQGIGAAALGEILRRYSDKGVFLEIESTHENAPNQAQRQKRKQFYLSCGLEELNVTAKLFRVNMELLGAGCSMTFDEYKSFYRDNYSPWAADHIEEA